MSLRERLEGDLRGALKARQTQRVSTLRLLQSQLTNELFAAKKDALSDEEVQRVIQREVKKRREAASAYRTGGREDAAVKEDEERAILEAYLPQQMSDDELLQIVREVVGAAGAKGKGETGKVMGMVMGRVKGKADGTRVRTLVEQVLSS